MSDPDDCAVREAYHRCSNDLQLVVSMLQLTSRRCAEPSTQQTLGEIANRVRVLAHARSELLRKGRQDLGGVLRGVCEALQAMAEPNGVLIRLSVAGNVPPLSDAATTAVGLAVNELVTNALKHAFKEKASGEVIVKAFALPVEGVVVLVDDDGLPFSGADVRANSGHQPLGLDLARKMLAAQGGTLIAPSSDSKCFQIRVPAQTTAGLR